MLLLHRGIDDPVAMDTLLLDALEEGGSGGGLLRGRGGHSKRRGGSSVSVSPDRGGGFIPPPFKGTEPARERRLWRFLTVSCTSPNPPSFERISSELRARDSTMSVSSTNSVHRAHECGTDLLWNTTETSWFAGTSHQHAPHATWMMAVRGRTGEHRAWPRRREACRTQTRACYTRE